MFLLHYLSPWFVWQIYNVVKKKKKIPCHEFVTQTTLNTKKPEITRQMCSWSISVQHGFCAKFTTWFMNYLTLTYFNNKSVWSVWFLWQIHNVVYETKICFWFIILQHGFCDKFITWFMRQTCFWFISVQFDCCEKVN